MCVAADISPEQVGAIAELVAAGSALAREFREDPDDLGTRVGQIARVMSGQARVLRASLEG